MTAWQHSVIRGTGWGIHTLQGVVGIVGLAVFLTATLPATIDDYVRHIDYAVSLIGIDHVAVGTDHTEGQGQAFWDSLQHGKGTIPFYQFTRGQAQVYPDQIASIAKQPNLTAALLRRGYREEDVARIRGGNWLRLFERVWRA